MVWRRRGSPTFPGTCPGSTVPRWDLSFQTARSSWTVGCRHPRGYTEICFSYGLVLRCGEHAVASSIRVLRPPRSHMVPGRGVQSGSRNLAPPAVGIPVPPSHVLCRGCDTGTLPAARVRGQRFVVAQLLSLLRSREPELSMELTSRSLKNAVMWIKKFLELHFH